MSEFTDDPNVGAVSAGRDYVMPLSTAIQRYVEHGQHLHFASTPSRANAAIRELGRQFVDQKPDFTLSTTGFHSTAHLLGLLRLGRRYVSCFFGDNYPNPRPNALYAQLENEGFEIEQWSLGSYVAAFRAGARGEQCAVTNSLVGSDLGRDLALKGLYVERPDPFGDQRPVGFVKALRADIAFLHAAVGDEDGNALFCPPSCEGFHAALGTTRGAIVTVERIVHRSVLAHYPNFIPLPSHRVLAICPTPHGAHPQPLHVEPESLRALAYGDDFRHYELWRRMTLDVDLFCRFRRDVLDNRDDEVAYRNFVREWNEVPAVTQAARPNSHPIGKPLLRNWNSIPDDTRSTILAARAITKRVIEGRMNAVLAGIGQSFAAARLAKAILHRRGYFAELLVETGLSDFDPLTADGFLLGYRNILASKRLTDVDHVLGTLVCGNGSQCLGVIGAAQVDSFGNVNSTRVSGRLLVGSGGANDIASAANEIIVVTRAAPERFPVVADYVTSPGLRALSIVTECWELERKDVKSPWHVRQWLANSSNTDGPSNLPVWVNDACAVPSAAAPTDEELEMIESMSTNETPTLVQTSSINAVRSLA